MLDVDGFIKRFMLLGDMCYRHIFPGESVRGSYKIKEHRVGNLILELAGYRYRTIGFFSGEDLLNQLAASYSSFICEYLYYHDGFERVYGCTVYWGRDMCDMMDLMHEWILRCAAKMRVEDQDVFTVVDGRLKLLKN